MEWVTKSRDSNSEYTANKNQMNAALWDLGIEKAWEVDVKVLPKKAFDRKYDLI